MALLVAGNASVLDLILQGDRKPGDGEVGVLTSTPGAQGQWSAGGAAFTVALAARTQGVETAVLHPLPIDADADANFAPLRRAGVDLSRALRIDAAVGRCILISTPTGRSAWATATPRIALRDFESVLAGVTHLVIVSRWEDWTEALIACAVRNKIPISLIGEPATQAYRYTWANVILDQQQLAAVSPIKAEVIVETRGARGAVVHHDGRELSIAAASATLVDATGAGDAFGGVFVACRLKGEDVVACALKAAEVAARTCEGWGAWAAVAGVRVVHAAEQREQRVRGALAGTACGDAFGMPNSFLAEPLWRCAMMEGPRESPYHAGYPAGRITDDTEQALALTDALEDGFSAEAAAHRLNEWFNSVGGEKSLAVGPSTKRAMLAFQAHVPLKDIGRTGVTNGAAMRIAPIGVLAGLRSLSLERLVDVVELACLPTHHTGVAIAGAAAIAAAIAAAVDGKAWEAVMSASVDGARLGAGRGAWIYSASVADRILHARRLAASAGDERELLHLISDVVGAGEPTTESVPAALAIADYAGGDPARAIELAGNLRGDTDTVAAMAGAVCGAYAGEQALPRVWLDTVSQVNALDFAHWAQRLMRCAEAAEAPRLSSLPATDAARR